MTILAFTSFAFFMTSHLCHAYRTDIKVGYFSTNNLTCVANETDLPTSATVFWITPDGSVVNLEHPRPAMLPRIQLVDRSKLQIAKINDDQFGMYTCVMRLVDGEVKVAQWGVNVHGADFSDLQDVWIKNATVGGIVAAVFVAVFACGCIIWYFRCSKRSNDNADTGSAMIERSYHNVAFQVPRDVEFQDTVKTMDVLRTYATPDIYAVEGQNKEGHYNTKM